MLEAVASVVEALAASLASVSAVADAFFSSLAAVEDFGEAASIEVVVAPFDAAVDATTGAVDVAGVEAGAGAVESDMTL